MGTLGQERRGQVRASCTFCCPQLRTASPQAGWWDAWFMGRLLQRRAEPRVDPDRLWVCGISPCCTTEGEPWAREGGKGGRPGQSITYGLTAISVLASRTNGARGTGGTGSTRGASRASLTTVTLGGRGGGRGEVSVGQHNPAVPSRSPLTSRSPWDQQHHHDQGHLQHREHPREEQRPPC